MTPETKNAALEAVAYRVTGRWVGDRMEVAGIEHSARAAEDHAGHMRDNGWVDVEVRPLYDVDAPGMLEALEAVEWSGRGRNQILETWNRCCPACGAFRPIEVERGVHMEDCSLRAAIAKARGDR